MLTVNAAISCTAGDGVPSADNPSAASAGNRHLWQRRHLPRALHLNRAEAGLNRGAVPDVQAAQRLLADRTARRHRIRLRLRRIFQHLAHQLVTASQQLLFHVAEVFLGRADAARHPIRQAHQLRLPLFWQKRLHPSGDNCFLCLQYVARHASVYQPPLPLKS